MSKKLILEFVKKEFEKEEYKLLTKVYKNNKQKLDYICKRGHKRTITWSDWQQERRCLICFRENNSGKNHHNYGKKFSKEHRRNLAQAKKDKKHTEKTKQKISKKNKGRIFSKEHRKRISKSQIGENNSMYGKCGTLSPTWKGGISCEPYCQDWTKEFKDFIKERDGNKCLNPYCFGNIHRLSVHHIDYNKKNCESENLITLCVSCNSCANKDREWHEAWYKAIIYRRYVV